MFISLRVKRERERERNKPRCSATLDLELRFLIAEGFSDAVSDQNCRTKVRFFSKRVLISCKHSPIVTWLLILLIIYVDDELSTLKVDETIIC